MPLKWAHLNYEVHGSGLVSLLLFFRADREMVSGTISETVSEVVIIILHGAF